MNDYAVLLMEMDEWIFIKWNEIEMEWNGVRVASQDAKSFFANKNILPGFYSRPKNNNVTIYISALLY